MAKLTNLSNAIHSQGSSFHKKKSFQLDEIGFKEQLKSKTRRARAHECAAAPLPVRGSARCCVTSLTKE